VTLEDGATVSDLLQQLGWGKRTVAVEHNGEALLRSEHPSIVLRDGDTLEIVKAVAGG
jgi:sulfur carrier protein